MKITVILPSEEFERFDSFCQDRGFKKSTLIARLIRDFLCWSVAVDLLSENSEVELRFFRAS